MKKGLKIVAIVATVVGCLSLTAPAFADDAPTPTPYTIIAWTMGPNSTPADPFVDTQHFFKSLPEVTLDLDALDSLLLCGTTYQIDGEHTSDITAALIAGGILTSPQHPNAEDHAYGTEKYGSTPWKYVTTDVCPTPTPTPTPTVPPVIPLVTPPTPPVTPQLAHTGVNPTGGLLLGGALVLMGAGLTMTKRRRKLT